MNERVGWNNRLKRPLVLGVAACTLCTGLFADQARSVQGDPLPTCSSGRDTTAGFVGDRFDRVDRTREETAIPEVSRDLRLREFGSSVVRVATGYGHGGTGFVVRTPRGESVVVTAAHVAREHALSDFALTSFDGANVSRYNVVGGCVVRKDRKHATPADDIAILEVNHPEQLPDPLELGSEISSRTGISINYQLAGKDEHGTPLQHGERDPVVVSVKPVMQAGDMILALSGMDGDPLSKDMTSAPILPGASGSPVIQDGRVVGMVTTAAIMPIDMAEQAVYGVTGRMYEDGLIDSDVIGVVLESKELNQ